MWQNTKNGSIYVIKAVGIKPPVYKIGRSTNIQKRLDALQSASPVRLTMIITKQVCDMGVERHLHRIFDVKRLRGEWFYLTEQDLRWIKEMDEQTILEQSPSMYNHQQPFRYQYQQRLENAKKALRKKKARCVRCNSTALRLICWKCGEVNKRLP